MIIYEANETDFFSNGLGTLPDATSALVTEERNGEFVLDVIYPQQGLRSELLTKNRIIKADAGHELKDQRFVIKKVTPTMDSDGYIYLAVHAEHVSYITADLGVTPNLTLSGNATQALEQWQANLVGGHPDIVVDSDIISEHETSLDITKTTNARQVLGGVEGSILDTWGGEYKFDNLHISLRGQRGTTANTLISYGRNLLTFEQEDDITDTYTSIYPYANVGLADGNSSKLVTVDGYFVDSQYVDRYPNRKLLPVDFGSQFTDYKIGSKPSEGDSGIYTTEAEIKKKLTELAKQYIENNRIGIPKVSTKITFADLSKTSEYAPLEQVNLCDIIPIRFEKLGIDTTIKVTRVVWNVLLDEYDSIELGDLRTTLGESISALENKTAGLANAVITAQSTADNQNSIFRTNGGTAEPVAKKKGDLWFKTDGDYQYMYQWDGAVWHEVVNTKTTDDIAKEVDQARVKMEKLVKKANDDTTIFRTEGQETAPTAKKKGDLWFKTDNGQTVMHEWDGQKWHEIVSTKTTEDITKQVEQAQADLAQVRADATRISETQSEADKRLSDRIESVSSQAMADAQNLTNQLSQAQDTLNAKILDAQSTLDGKISTVSTDLSAKAQVISGIQQDLTAKQKSLDTLSKQAQSQGSAIGTLQSDVTGIKGQYADLSGNVNSLQASASGLQADMKDAKGNISSLQAKASGFEASMKNAQGDIASVQVDVNGLKTTVAGKVDNSTYATFTEQTNKKIELTATKLDNLSVGARNWLQGTADFSVKGGLRSNNIDAGNLTYSDYNDKIKMVRISEKTRYGGIYTPWGQAFPNGQLQVGDDYTFSFDAKGTGTFSKVTNEGENKAGLDGVSLTDSWKRYSVTGKITALNKAYTIYFKSNYDVYIKCLKVERGTIATDWTPAPEDLATVVSVNKVIDTADSHTQIIKDYLTNYNSQFKLLKNAVNLKVEKGDVIGQINLEAGKTLIQNQKVYLDADTVAFSNKAFIPSAAITDLSADKITTGTLNAAKLNVINLNANSINAGTLSGAYLHITKDSYIDNASIDGAKIKSLDAGKITTGTLDATNVNIINLNVNKLSGDKTSFIKSSWNSISNYIDIDPYRLRVGNSSNGYIDLTSNGMHVYSSFNNEEMGWIHANNYRGHPEQNGLEFDLNAPYGDYMAWAMQEKEHEDYILQMEFRRSNWGNKQQGLNIYSDVKFHNKIWPSDGATGYGAMRLIRANFGGQWGNEFAMDGYQSGIWFGDNGGLAIIIRGKYLMLSDVKFPTAINSDGTVQTWNSF